MAGIQTLTLTLALLSDGRLEHTGADFRSAMVEVALTTTTTCMHVVAVRLAVAHPA